MQNELAKTIFSLIDPNRSGGVSHYELEPAVKELAKLDDLVVNLQAENARLRTDLSDSGAMIGAQSEIQADYEHEVKQLRAALEAVEWVTRNGQKMCPWCWHDISTRSHAGNCQRQIALGKAAG